MSRSKCRGLKGKAKELCEDGKLLIKAHLMNSITEDDWEEGAGTEHSMSISEKIYAKDFDELDKELKSYGLDLDEFRVFDDENNRLTFNRNEDKDGNPITLTKERPKGYLVDYDIYIEMHEEIPVDLKKIGFKPLY